MDVCDFNMCFAIALCGWEGFVHDANILMDTLRKPDLPFPYPAKGKYYLVDSGYPSLKGFLSPYNNASFLRRTNSSDLDILESLENINGLQDNEEDFHEGVIIF
ncbi:unnamed protein product [Lathyrus oleraceus]